MDKELFELAIAAAERIIEKNSSIGTKSELHVHSALKYYFQPDMTMHEIKREGFICDAVTDDGVIEIQTASFKSLRAKLEKLLPLGRFTVVYPIINSKIIVTADSETGEVTERKSPKKAGIYSVFRELCSIPDLVSHPNFRLCIVILSAREFRVKYPEKIRVNKRSYPKNYVKTGRVPTELVGETEISSLDGFRRFIPDGLGEGFFSSDFARCAKIKQNEASATLRFMFETGLVDRIGRTKNGYIYKVIKNS